MKFHGISAFSGKVAPSTPPLRLENTMNLHVVLHLAHFSQFWVKFAHFHEKVAIILRTVLKAVGFYVLRMPSADLAFPPAPPPAGGIPPPPKMG